MGGRTMDERRLYELKWFDYRPLSPDTATVAFMCEFWKRLATVMKDDLGDDRAPYRIDNMIMKLADKPPKTWRDFQMGETLRSWSDRNFMRYDHFWMWAFEEYLGMSFGTKGLVKGKKDRTIIMNYFNYPKILSKVQQRRGQHEADRVIWSEHPYFKPEAFEGTRLQLDYFDYVVCAVKRLSGARASHAIRRMVDNGKIPKCYFVYKAVEAAEEHE